MAVKLQVSADDYNHSPDRGIEDSFIPRSGE